MIYELSCPFVQKPQVSTIRNTHYHIYYRRNIYKLNKSLVCVIPFFWRWLREPFIFRHYLDVKGYHLDN